jgi:hypothetical protein
MGEKAKEFDNAHSSSPADALSEWNEVCAGSSWTVSPALYRISKWPQNTTCNTQSGVLQRGTAADQYSPGPDLCGDGRSSATRIVDLTAAFVNRDHFMLSTMCGQHAN